MSYQPQSLVADLEVQKELQAISEALNGIGKMRVFYREPERPREGNFCICDGTSWNPLGDGIKRAIWFNGTTWQAF